MRSLRARVERLQSSVIRSRPSGPHVVLIDRSGRRPPGLHPVGPPGSLAAVWSVGPGERDDVRPAGVPRFAVIIGGEIDPDAI